METKSISTEIKASGDGGFEGYASVFSQRDSYDDMVIAGAYTKTIQERKGKIRALWNHDAMTPPIGKFTRMEEDSYGLAVTAEFSKTAFAQDVRTLVQEQALDAMSIGYSVVKADYGTENDIEVRYLREIKLYEVSIVAFPALESALITDAKSVSHLERTIKQLDELISVGIKSGRPLSAENLTRLQKSYTDLHALLQAKAEPDNTTPLTPEAADQEPEPQPHSDDLLTALKSFTPTIQHKSEEAAIVAELKNAFAFIHKGV